MGKHKETKLEWLYRVVVPKVTSFGAAFVVIGALFKIEHLPGASYMLGGGLIVEAALFFLGVFQPAAPPEAHYDWEKVYPGLVDPNAAPAAKNEPKKDDKKSLAALSAIDKMLEESNLNADVFKNFGNGMKSLTTSVGQMKDLTNVSVASDEYTKSLQSATKSITDLNKAYAGVTTAMAQMGDSVKDAKAYHEQIQVITKNLGALNTVYEMELRDANSHLKAMNKFYQNLTVAMESMADASKESQTFKTQMTSLTTNLTSLNKVYGNMLSAMKGV